jgi:DNA repair protein RadC
MQELMIKEINKEERPRERLIKYGVSKLSNEELLSIILKTGTKNYSVKTLASLVLKEIDNINSLKDITINKLTKIKGIGKVKAIELLASLELGKRVYYLKENKDIILNNSTKVYEYFKDILLYEKQENFIAIYLDSKSRLISYKKLFIGTLNTSCVHPREIFKYAFLESAYSIIVVHNHPSGEVDPSIPDIELTNNLFNIGRIIGIPILDHIIIGANKYYSFYENMHKNK